MSLKRPLTAPPRSDDIEGDQRAPHDAGDSTPVDISVLASLGLLPRPTIAMEEVEIMCALPPAQKPGADQ